MNTTSRRTLLKGSAAVAVGAVAVATLPAGALSDAPLFEAIAAFRRAEAESEQIYAARAELAERVERAHPEVTRHFQIMRSLRPEDGLWSEDIQAKVSAEHKRAKPFMEAYHRDLKAAGYDEDKDQHIHDRCWNCRFEVMATPAYTIAGLLAKVEIHGTSALTIEDGPTPEDWAIIVTDLRRVAGAA